MTDDSAGHFSVNVDSGSSSSNSSGTRPFISLSSTASIHDTDSDVNERISNHLSAIRIYLFLILLVEVCRLLFSF